MESLLKRVPFWHIDTVNYNHPLEINLKLGMGDYPYTNYLGTLLERDIVFDNYTIAK